MVHRRRSWALAQLFLASLELVGGTDVPRLGGGGERNVSWGRSFCFKSGGPYFCNREDGKERKRTT